MRARWTAFIVRSMGNVGSGRVARPAPRSGWRTAGASGARNKGGRASIRRGLMRESRSKAGSGTFPQTHAGLLLHAIVHPAGIRDRDGGILLLSRLFGLFPFLRKPLADSAPGRAGLDRGSGQSRAAPETETVVGRSDTATGFVVLPKRWIAEPAPGRLNRCGRLAKDRETSTSRRPLSCPSPPSGYSSHHNIPAAGGFFVAVSSVTGLGRGLLRYTRQYCPGSLRCQARAPVCYPRST